MSQDVTFRDRVATAIADERVGRSIRLATLHKVDARAEALSQVAGLMLSPASQLVGQLLGPGSSLASQFKSMGEKAEKAEKKEKK